MVEIVLLRTCHDKWQRNYKFLDLPAFQRKLIEKYVLGLAAVVGTAYSKQISDLFPILPFGCRPPVVEFIICF